MKYLICFLIFLFILPSLNADNKWFSKDKIMHFSGSAFLTCWNYGLSRDILNQNKDNSYFFAISLTTVLGLCKEASDKYIRKEQWCWIDIIYNIAGISFSLILINNMS